MNRDMKLVIAGAVASVTATASVAASLVIQARQPAPMERCYGVSSTAQNDCQTVSNSCAGTSTTERQWDAFITVPKGLCQKISGGTTGDRMVAKPAVKSS